MARERRGEREREAVEETDKAHFIDMVRGGQGSTQA